MTVAALTRIVERLEQRLERLERLGAMSPQEREETRLATRQVQIASMRTREDFATADACGQHEFVSQASAETLLRLVVDASPEVRSRVASLLSEQQRAEIYYLAQPAAPCVEVTSHRAFPPARSIPLTAAEADALKAVGVVVEFVSRVAQTYRLRSWEAGIGSKRFYSGAGWRAPEFITLHRSGFGSGEVETKGKALVVAG